ncbi:MAG: polyprenyl synthetase family protein [Candidatus Omnitrophota bacterium]
MLDKIKNNIEKNLKNYIKGLNKPPYLNQYPNLLSKSISDFIFSKGKRIRPTLFVLSYLGFSKNPAYNLYKASISMELFHNFMLIHDDIIDNANLRRGKLSLHRSLDNYLKKYKYRKFEGKDLAIIIGDVIYSMAIQCFLSINEDCMRKQRALGKLTETAISTGLGEFNELIYSLKDMDKIKKEDIYKIYDLKTAYYTFSLPLSAGAILAGIEQNQINKLIKYGLYLGRAFQIKDDILDMFGKQKQIGKSTLTDLKEGKKTILILYAYQKSSLQDKKYINKIFSKNKFTCQDLIKIRKIVKSSNSLEYAKKEILLSIKKAKKISISLKIKPVYKDILNSYCQELLKI